MHVEAASERVPTGKVLYRSDSALRKLQAERDEDSEGPREGGDGEEDRP